ncbi:MAG: hypothetical protein CL865_12080 [Cycloclasticus sp.]|nr:hypothetical protein [Cycloclasticus sp.]
MATSIQLASTTRQHWRLASNQPGRPFREQPYGFTQLDIASQCPSLPLYCKQDIQNNVLQYFISTHGARKGLADTALKTANTSLPAQMPAHHYRCRANRGIPGHPG